MIVAEVVRSGFVESVHHGAVAVLGGAGRGDVTRPIFPRSSLRGRPVTRIQVPSSRLGYAM